MRFKVCDYVFIARNNNDIHAGLTSRLIAHTKWYHDGSILVQLCHAAIIASLLLHGSKETALYQTQRGGLDHKWPREWTKHPSLSVYPEVRDQRWKSYCTSPSVRIPAVLYLLQWRTLLIHEPSDAALTNLPAQVQINSWLQTGRSQNANSGATFHF